MILYRKSPDKVLSYVQKVIMNTLNVIHVLEDLLRLLQSANSDTKFVKQARKSDEIWIWAFMILKQNYKILIEGLCVYMFKENSQVGEISRSCPQFFSKQRHGYFSNMRSFNCPHKAGYIQIQTRKLTTKPKCQESKLRCPH